MAQLPDVDDTTNNSLMDDVKVNPTSQNEAKQALYDQNFNDNDSLKNHVDSNDIGVDDIHHSIIQNRDNAPEPPSSLTMASLQHFDDENPPQNMLIGTNLAEERSGGGNSSQPIPDLGLGDMLGSFASHNTHNVPDMLIDPLIEMGFHRKKAIYALQQSERMIGTMSVEYALQWLFENPTFQVPDTANITATINNMLGTKMNNKTHAHATDPLPPNNSPKPIECHDTNTTDTFLYDLMETASHAMDNNNNNSSKSNRIYKHSGTLGSAATEEEKHDRNTDALDVINRHHTNTSTLTSELSVLSVDNSNNATNNTKDQIHQLYREQQHMNRIAHATDTIPTDLKMVIVVRKDLKMSCGKVAAQCCHGCLGVVMDIMNKQHININNSNLSGNVYDLRLILRLWRMNGEKKIVLQCANEDKLMKLKDEALIQQLPHYLVSDAGHTQIKAGSKTVLAIGPYPSVDIDKLTKELKLY